MLKKAGQRDLNSIFTYIIICNSIVSLLLREDLGMPNKNAMVIGIIILFGFSLVISIPIVTFVYNLAEYGKIDEKLSFFQNSNNYSNNRLNLEVDVGDVIIKYIYPPEEYCVKINIFIEMSGQYLADKKYSDFFIFSWENESSPLNFIMRIKPGINQLNVLELIRNITILVSLRSDIVFDISVSVRSGNVEICIPFAVGANNLEINITEGNLLVELLSCTIGGNLIGICDNGNIEFKSYDADYTRNCNWTLFSNKGNILVEILQENDLGANVSGTISSNSIESGFVINLIYRDYTDNVGAIFALYHTVQIFLGEWSGFTQESLGGGLFGYKFTSFDFPSLNHYNLSFFDAPSSGGHYLIDLLNT